MWLVEAAAPAHAQRWREQEGRWEFTGKMVVRPLQVEHWMERGFSRERAQELYTEATAYTGRAGEDNEFKAAGATNTATVRFYYGSATGQTAVSGCSNVYVGIANASILGTATAGANGAAILEDYSVPSGWAGQTRYLQAVDVSDCRVSNLIQYTFPI